MGILFVDPKLRIHYANPKAAKILGCPSPEALISVSLTRWDRLAEPAVMDQIRRCLDDPQPQPMRQLPGQTPSGLGALKVHAAPVKDDRGSVVGVQILLEDLSDVQRIESEMRHSYRQETMGILADGIVRDFSNILWEIMGNAELAATEIEIGHPARYNLEQAEAACRRAQELIMRVVRFSRHSEQKKKPVKLSAIVNESLQQLAGAIPNNIHLEPHISTTKDLILAEPSEILQLLSHLYQNAVQAMSETGGTIEVSVVDVALEADELAEHPGLIPGRYLVLTVMDTGPGMDAELLGQVFDPFFSTKSPELHSGLGLAIVKSIARAHGGAVSLDSRPGKGTMVHLILPALRDAAGLLGKPHDSGLPAGIGTILLVDSDPSVRKMRGRMISHLGYEVQAAADSLEALAKFEHSPEDFDLILTDQSMPDLPAIQMARRMKEIRREIPILLCTSMTGPEVEADARAAGIDRLLIKPLRMKDLALTLREILPPSPAH